MDRALLLAHVEARRPACQLHVLARVLVCKHERVADEVEAIFAMDEVPDQWKSYIEKNAEHYQK